MCGGNIRETRMVSDHRRGLMSIQRGKDTVFDQARRRCNGTARQQEDGMAPAGTPLATP
jgi:hypothetical protein